MIATLIIVVCPAAAPNVCHEERPAIAMASGISCVMQGQQVAAQWLADHPKWMLRGWRCRFGGGSDI